MKTIFLFILNVIYSCQILAQHPVTKLRIDPDNAFGGNTRDFFEEVNFIPLETNEQSLFGKIYQLEVTDQYYIIYDSETNAILLFHKDGKFHTKINKRKKNEFFSVFALDRKAKEIILPTIGNLILFYNYNGKLIKEKKSDLAFERLFFVGDSLYVLNQPRLLKKSETSRISHDLVFTKDFKKSIMDFFPFDQKYQIMDYNLPIRLFSDQGDRTCYFSFPYNYNVFGISATGITSEFQFLFPEKYSLPKDFSTGEEFSSIRKEYVFNPLPQNMDKFISLGPFFKYNEWILFEIQKIGGYISNARDLLYNLETKKLYSMNLIIGDEISNYFPVLQARKQQRMNSLYDGVLYTSISASSYMTIKKKILEDGLSIELPDMEKKANPILIRSVFKKNNK